jgi:HEAT repeat protein
MSRTPFQAFRLFLRALLWGARSWRAGDRLLRQDADAFKASGYRAEDFLGSPLWYLRNIGVKMIAKYRLQALYPVLYQKLADRSEAPIVRRNCAQLLSQLGAPPAETQPALLAALNDPYWEVRTEALCSLVLTQQPSEPVSDEIIRLLLGAAVPPVGVLGGSGPPALIERNFEVRATAAAALGRLGVPPRALDALDVLLTDENWIVRVQATTAIAEFVSRDISFKDQARRLLESANPASDGMVPWFVPKHKLRLALERLSEPKDEPQPQDFAPLYLDIKKGWYV